jgi:hypothetical protein
MCPSALICEICGICGFKFGIQVKNYRIFFPCWRTAVLGSFLSFRQVG